MLSTHIFTSHCGYICVFILLSYVWYVKKNNEKSIKNLSMHDGIGISEHW